MNILKPERKTFDVGLYSYKPIVHGLICPVDEARLRPGQILAVLHPLRRVDPKGLYAFAVTQDPRLGTLSLMRKNMRFLRVVSLWYYQPVLASYAEQTHLTLNMAREYILRQAGVQVDMEVQPQTLSL